ncbi:5-deoxy-glucuronate isomerase [Kribbella pittospori]|uniref:5-deoxy-glucuronate isomerase n=1 Tax=Kribbella pittospori TaxID=722689 RepID=UPI0013F48689|nr:5-deoxy-glucuronate isomerase [Kribbella pittospori]
MSKPQILTRGWSRIEPSDADWEYISFAVHELGSGQTLTLAAGPQERALIPLGGTAHAESGSEQWTFGGRSSVFDGLGWCLYVPMGDEVRVTAVTDVEIAVAEAPATQKFAPVLVTPDDVSIELRGGGNASRQVGSLMLPDFPADRLHVVEVWTPGGNWSSFPPHKHEQDREGEAQLEETYYYRLKDPENGWALQRVYSPERDFELSEPVRDGDLLLIPWGYHTTVAAHGQDLYYLNVLAGPAPRRTLQAFEDPCLAPAREQWPGAGLDARLPFVPRHPSQPS